MTEPKNSIVKQYEALFALDGIALEFDMEALERIAELTIERKTGARGLRSIIETALQEPMYETPSADGVTKVIITKETIDGGKATVIK
jgi:ATP-dependent Clp protease ATP-binding subunit ClpX